MKKYAITGIIIASLLSVILIQKTALTRAKNERNTYKNNTYALMSETQHYKTRDSLNAVSVSELSLKLSEFRQFRQEDAALIATLKVDKKRLESITTAQTQTIYDLRGKVKDSIVYVSKDVTDTLQCLKIATAWFDLDGCTNKDKEFSGSLITRDSLLYVEHIEPRRFLFFRFGVRNRKQEIISRNPHTVILDASFVTIRD